MRYWPGGRSVSSRLRPPKPRVITAMRPSPCGRAAAIPLPPVLPLGRWMPMWHPPHDVIVSECPGDELLRGEDVVARNPEYINWTIASRVGWRGTGRQVELAIGGLKQKQRA